ncbi:MAG: glucosaminidase domain-containing protein [Bacteroidales bacterium]
MHPLKGFLLVLFALIILTVPGQVPERKITREEYIEMYRVAAIEEMNAFGIPASIKLAQAILESGSGNSNLAQKANNHFGIKCHKGWNGLSYHMDDDEKNECFRQYNSPFDSYKDHSIFLTTRDRYAGLFQLDIKDYRSWAHGLKNAGYATNPKYPDLLIGIIENNRLYEYDHYYRRPYAELLKQERETADHMRKSTGRNEDFRPVSIGPAGRQVFENNGVKFIYANQGDTFHQIAQDFNIYTHQVYRNNELRRKDKIDEGQMIYLERKKKRHKAGVHQVIPGENLHSISQDYGIRLKNLARHNNLSADAQLFPGQKIRLK